MDPESPRVYKFGAFCLEVANRLLLQDGEPVQLTPKAFDTLLALVRRNGRVVKKDELLTEVWPDTFVEEATLAQNIFTLRKALGQSGDGPQYIETIPRHGYRFAAEVEHSPEVVTEVLVETLTRTHIVSEEIERSNPPDSGIVRPAATNIGPLAVEPGQLDRKSTRLNSSHANISYAVFCLKKK